MTDHGYLVILGNGFDLDLDFPTSYKHFVENENDQDHGAFPFVRGGEDYYALGRYVLEANIRDWFDLEDILATYGITHEHNVINQEDKSDYCKLVRSLNLYLQSLDLSHPKNDSVAARLLKAVTDCLIPPTIYSFNYTDVSLIGNALGLGVGSATHIHGSLAANDVILGVGDYVDLSPANDFMYKTSNEKYRSTNLFRELDTCDNILIFGLSLSLVDYPYFEGFFKKVSSGEYCHDRKKYIRIFTYDDESRMAILRNLRLMNKGMIALANYADFDIVRTKDNVDEEKVSIVLEKISTEWQIDIPS